MKHEMKNVIPSRQISIPTYFILFYFILFSVNFFLIIKFPTYLDIYLPKKMHIVLMLILIYSTRINKYFAFVEAQQYMHSVYKV